MLHNQPTSSIMSGEVAFVDVSAFWRRALLLVLIAFVIFGAWFIVRWHIGSTFAEYPADIETVMVGAQLAPDDAQSYFTLARLSERDLLPGALEEARLRYEQAVSRSPNDYRLWMEVGRVREAVGDRAGGEQALHRAVELAPAYATPRWRLGNILFRQGRAEEAFAELRRAGESDRELRPQIFNLMWRAYNGDTERILAAVGDSLSARAQFIEYLVGQRRLNDAERLWISFSDEERQAQSVTGSSLSRTLFEAKRFQSALSIQREIATGETRVQLPLPDQIANGNFEAGISAAGSQLFGWQVASVAQVQIHLDPRNGHGGAGRSLRILFNAPIEFDFSRGVSQLVVVSPATRYRLQYRVRTENLRTISTLTTDAIDPATLRVLASSAPVPAETNDWQMVTLEFATGETTEGVIVRIARQPCSEATCPIFGRIWYDDFNLERIGGESRAERE